MAIEKKFINKFSQVTAKAALAASYLVGKKDKNAADKAAVDSMRSELNKINTSLITDTKLHSQFTFTRYRSDNSIIGQYQAIYIIIYFNEKWGIKGGSGNG